MLELLEKAMQASVTFNFANVTPSGQSAADKKVALFPGIYDTMKQITADGKVTAVCYTDPTNLNNAGYACDEVADDYNAASGVYVQVTGNPRCKWRDFLNYVRRVGVRCTQIVIQNKSAGSNQAIFDQEFAASRTVVGVFGGANYIQLQDYVSVDAYDRSKITIDLSSIRFILNPELFMSLTIPTGTNISIQFKLETLDYQG